MNNIYAIIVAAGRGTRMGMDVPKQFLPLGDKRVIEHSIDKFTGILPKQNIVLVLSEPYLNDFEGFNAVEGGKTRQDSVKNAVLWLKEHKSPEKIIIHDAARPFFDLTVLETMIDALDTHIGATFAAPLVDSLRHKENGSIARDKMYAVQTPQGFQAQALINVHINAESNDFTDDASLVEHFGGDIAILDSSASNFKITSQEDYERALTMVSQKTIPRIGQGFDVHAFDYKEHVDTIRLCGIDVPHPHPLKGHSDADVGLHAITDALLGALALGDIGEHFPPSDKTLKNIDSALILNDIINILKDKNARINNIDVTLICETPKITSYKASMRKRISEVCNIIIEQVSVKATTTEKLGFTGRKEGIAAQAVAMIEVSS